MRRFMGGWGLALALAPGLTATAVAGSLADWKGLCKRGTASVVTELKIGGGPDEGEDAPIFREPYHVAVAADGSFYVVDADGVIIHFNADGAERNRFGRRGEGPGELMRPGVAVIDARGRLVVHEVGNRRFSIFQPDGTFIETKPVQETIHRIACAPDGSFILQRDAASASKPWHSIIEVVRCDDAFGHPAVIDSFEVRSAFLLGGSQPVTIPYTPQMRFCLLPGGLVACARDDRYEIRVVGPDLKPRYTLRRDIAAPAVTKEDRESYYKAYESRGPDFVARLRDEVPWPKHKGCIADFFADGRFLVVTRRNEGTQPPTLDVFDGERFVGEVSVPEFRQPWAVHDGRCFRPQYSRDELPSIVVYRIQ
jgi:hypothetical protein